jgi:hypothetical protein
MTNPNSPVGDDGEIQYEYDSGVDDFKIKRRPDRYTVRIPMLVIFPISLLLLFLGILLLVQSWQEPHPQPSGTEEASPQPSGTEEVSPQPFDTINWFRPDLPFNQVRLLPDSTSDGESYIYTTATPANYTSTRCDQSLLIARGEGTIMFSSGYGDNKELYAIDANGQNLCRVTQNLIEEHMAHWSYDRRSIVYISRRSYGNSLDIFTMLWDGTNLLNIAPTRDFTEYDPRWSIDGQQIVFSSTRNGNSNNLHLFIINRDGTNLTNLTNGRRTDRLGGWSPDNQEIIFSSDADNRGVLLIYVINRDGSNLRNLTNEVTGYVDEWSPDANKLTFSPSQDMIDRGVWIMDLKTFDTRQVAPDGSGGQSAWSPDGKQIAYIHRSDLYITPIDEHIPTLLVQNMDIHEIAGWR